MDSDYFFGMIGQFETGRVKAYKGEIDSSAFHRVPRPFGMLMHCIIDVFNENVGQFCAPKEKVVLIGFQPVAIKYHSDLPINLNRIYSRKDPRAHFCCTLEFITVPIAQHDNFKWEHTDSILIDFSSGQIIDRANFLKLISGNVDNIHYLGQIENNLLNTAWQIYRLRKNPRPS